MSVSPISSPHDAANYVVVVYRNVMIQNVTGAIDAAFLRASLAGHHAALAHDPTGYAVITMVEPSAKVPPGPVRDEAALLREKTQHMLKAQSVLIGSDGFFASTMRAVITGIVTLARSRVPLRMVGDEQAAADFVVERACPTVEADALRDVLMSLRRR